MIAPKVKQVTSVDVAKAAGVSRAAVSRTFSNNGYVSETTRNKVMAAAKGLGYRVNYLARSLNRQRSDLVGLVVTDMDNPFRSQQVNDLSDALLANNYRPLLIPTAKDRDSSQIIDMLMCYNVSGVIITSDTPPEAIFQNCIEHHVPVVLINKLAQHAKVDRIICDNEKGVALLIKEFAAKKCQNIAIISSKNYSYSIQQRESFFCEYAASENINIEILRPEKHCYQGGLTAAQSLLNNPTLPDGIFCTNDYLALGVIDGLKEHLGIEKITNIAIAGFDDMPQSSWVSYQLTTVKQTTSIMAKHAVQLLQNRIDNPEQEARTIQLDVELVRRSTL
ncbi:LacI family DNA-binding transcriptional regulator [Photobacterium profundum]|uniref:Transcriptional regulator, LacI family protein n=1 Tax=Photobacterium profundum 3TCK TaxID=314280 RepID=Q1ZBB0_9GAMM|nr:LacI family DNA-binding transcriptional regulator [Photobacterium profundum]EAS45232.1 transcriptional regulator, LacI family protein [Photobacterium profundum 3TCK]PSV63566.1 LacI family DNA-binding transcriptional regulator [Photobacterium profundum]